MVLLLLLTSCDPCVPWSAIEIGDPFSMMSASDHEVVDQALADFEDFSGRASVCVERIDVVDADTSEVWQARYFTAEHRIQLDATGPIREALTHELCHALDYHEGITRDHRAAFDPDLVAAAYPLSSRLMRQREVFAYLCQEGPEPADLAWRLATECGDDIFQPAARRLVQQLVWPDVERLPWESPQLEVQLGAELTSWTQSDLPRGLLWHAADMWLDTFLAVVSQDVMRLRPQLLLRTLGEDQWRTILLDLDLAPGTGWTEDLRFVPGTDGPVLLRVSDGATWIIDPVAGSTQAGRAVDATREQLYSALAVFEEQVLSVDSDGTSLSLIQPTGTRAIPLPASVLSASASPSQSPFEDVFVIEDSVWLWTWDEILVEVDLTTATATERAHLPPLVSSVTRAPLSDGRWLVQLTATETERYVFVVWDPAADQWLTPFNVCADPDVDQLYAGRVHPWVRTSDGVRPISLP